MARNRLNKAFNLEFPQHKKAQIGNDAKDVLQVIGAGLPRSGTTSLKAALEILGFDPCHHMTECIEYPKRSLTFANLISSKDSTTPEQKEERAKELKTAMRGYRATVDSPCCDLFDELLALYPTAKVVLSVRDSDEVWWKSFSDTLLVQMKKRYEWLVYPISFLRYQEVLFLTVMKRWKRVAGIETLGPSIHKKHNERVKAKVEKGKLLMFNVKQGWAPLCEFLGAPVPEEPFPSLNDSKTIKRAHVGGQLMGACLWLLYSGLAAGSVSLLMRPSYFSGLFGKVF